MSTTMAAPQTAGRPGLHYAAGFVSPEEQAELVREVDARPWRSDLSRRVQHYGYVYDYRARVITPEHYLGELPPFLQRMAERLHESTGLFGSVPVQCIVNEYGASQGIGWHYDARTFGPAIATVSLLEDWTMEFHPAYRPKLVHGDRNSLLERGSVLTMTGTARYAWFHSIPKLEREPDGTPRGRRISLTFRTLAEA